MLSFQAFAAEIPPLTGRIVDNANMIDPATRAALTARLQAYEKKSTDQIVVATVDSLDGEAIEPYATRMFRTWKLGRREANNGVLLLVARSDREMRIEVGYGLERALSNRRASEIIDGMVPRFKAGEFSAGIDAAVGAIVESLQAGLPCGSRQPC